MEFSGTAAAAAPAGVIILVLPARMILIRIKPPAEQEMLAMPVLVLLGSNRLADRLCQIAIRPIAAFVGGLGMLAIRFHTRQRHPPFALRGFPRAALQLCAGHLGMDFRHCHSPFCSRVIDIEDHFSVPSAANESFTEGLGIVTREHRFPLVLKLREGNIVDAKPALKHSGVLR